MFSMFLKAMCVPAYFFEIQVMGIIVSTCMMIVDEYSTSVNMVATDPLDVFDVAFGAQIHMISSSSDLLLFIVRNHNNTLYDLAVVEYVLGVHVSFACVFRQRANYICAIVLYTFNR